MLLFKSLVFFLVIYSNRIEALLGGVTVGPASTIFESYIQYNETKICSGAVLNGTTVVTLASCIDEDLLEEYQLVAGNWADYQIEPYNYFNITSVTYHPTDDLCLITTERSLIFYDMSAPIPIYDSDWIIGMEGAVSGWGASTYPTLSFPTWELYYNIWIVDPKNCQVGNDPTRFCISAGPGQSVCNGDGGDTVYTGQTGILNLIGLITSDLPCGQESVPNVAYNMTYYKPWFEDMGVIPY